ncbi:calcium uptake protein 3, mitochondrial isoform X1 [Hydra vulgaris]|uniref:calcium uptake protein 3, mitochondrial isoform X1 n=1 Tax=Hydra vulgaris TaxID=6087 RepID=UPI0006417442|nr:calcium uptake protein 3, mitochondrial [Hydra vulgaris]
MATHRVSMNILSNLKSGWFLKSSTLLNRKLINLNKRNEYAGALLKVPIQRHSKYLYQCVIIGTAAFSGLLITFRRLNTVQAESIANDDNVVSAMTRRESRFNEFASCEYQGHVVMTPFDFVESLIENRPKTSRSSKIRLTEKDIKEMVKFTPGISKGSSNFFRDLDQKGIITYSEYIFLVTILTKSYAGLKIALKMIDVNDDKEITLEEFQMIVQMIDKSSQSYKQKSNNIMELKKTTLLLHLFGKKGNQVVSFDRFFKFIEDLQNEVLELEFNEYSKGVKRITEIEFAKILLRNTILSQTDYSQYISRLEKRIQHAKGISLNQFKSFHKFLSNFEDFVIVVNMTNTLNHPIDKELFARTVKITSNEDVDPYVIDVVFNLFDEDGDGKLSQNEFIGIMKDRLKRGFGKFPNPTGIDGFKNCLRKEMFKPFE